MAKDVMEQIGRRRVSPSRVAPGCSRWMETPGARDARRSPLREGGRGCARCASPSRRSRPRLQSATTGPGPQENPCASAPRGRGRRPGRRAARAGARRGAAKSHDPRRCRRETRSRPPGAVCDRGVSGIAARIGVRSLFSHGGLHPRGRGRGSHGARATRRSWSCARGRFGRRDR